MLQKQTGRAAARGLSRSAYRGATLCLITKTEACRMTASGARRDGGVRAAYNAPAASTRRTRRLSYNGPLDCNV